jgi:4-diphosphocytidyl-2-C-methyl-D-erythritol kinase
LLHFEPCPIKINSALFVLGRREDGRHDLLTFFRRLGPVETLTIREGDGNNVRDRLFLRDAALGLGRDNLVLRAAAHLRREGVPLPSLEVGLVKRIPAGSGLGGGSGNAAALWRWALRRFGGTLAPERSLPLGADVPFLASGAASALAGGLGERMEFLPGGEDCLPLVLAVPRWRSSTAAAFVRLDARGGGELRNEGAARERIRDLRGRLRAGRRVGLLPNDFAPILCEEHNEYGEAFRVASSAGALGWGLSGSGSAFFALYPPGELSRGVRTWSRFGWIENLYAWE